MAEFTFKVKGGREDFRRTSVILLNSGASHPKVADDGTVTVRADRGNPFAGIASQLRNESVKAFFKCDTVRVSGIKNQAGAAEISRILPASCQQLPTAQPALLRLPRLKGLTGAPS